MAYKYIPFNLMSAFCERVFKEYGFSSENGRFITDVLLSADLFGIESHGVQRLVRYDYEIRSGMVKLDGKPEIVFETPVSAAIDGNNAMGQLNGQYAMNLAIEKAKKSGIGLVSVRHSNHYGIAGYYTRMALEEDLIGVCMTNTEAIMVPTFGKEAMIGTNPIALSMPADPLAFNFDSATTVVPRGKVEVYNKKGIPLPDGWAIDTRGLVSNNPGEVLHNIINKLGGGILPLGGFGEENSGHKGYGLGVICELFTAIMAGGATSNHLTAGGKDVDIKRVANDTSTSHAFWAIDYGIFGNKTEIRKNFSVFLQELRDCAKADGQERIYTHGEKEIESAKRVMAEGVGVNEITFAELKRIGGQLGIDSEAYIGGSF